MIALHKLLCVTQNL
uniref:Uncharacterized protein n=1 Tax=Rhizophora mucronata TaxID=61149 RepID=A0A2P2N7R8_RHIMU